MQEIFNIKHEETLQYHFERLNEVMQLCFPRLFFIVRTMIKVA